MGFLSRLLGPREAESFAPPSEEAKARIMKLGMSCEYDALEKNLRSKNPHVRAFTVQAVLFAGHTRSAGGVSSFSSDAALDLRAVRLLIPLLNDGEQRVREAAYQGLQSSRHNADVARALEEYRASRM